MFTLFSVQLRFVCRIQSAVDRTKKEKKRANGANVVQKRLFVLLFPTDICDRGPAPCLNLALQVLTVTSITRHDEGRVVIYL